MPWLSPVVFLVAYVGVHAALLGGIVVPRVSADWMPAVALAGMVLGLSAWRWRGPAWGLWALRGAVLVAVGLACASGKIRHGWAPGEGVPIMAGFVVHSLAVWRLVERIADRERGAVPPTIMAFYALSVGQVTALAYYSLKVSQMPTVMAACMGSAAVVGLLRPGLSLSRGGMDVPVLVTQAALFQGWLYSSGEGGRWFPLVLLGIPLSAVLAGMVPARGWKGAAARIVASGLVAGAAVGLAIALRPASDY